MAFQQTRYTDARRHQTTGAFVEHQRDRRIDELHRARRSGGEVGGAMRVLLPCGPLVPIRIENPAKVFSRERSAVRDERSPIPRPAEIAHELARQAEREVEAADPGTGPGEEIGRADV